MVNIPKVLIIGSILTERQYVVDEIAGPNQVAYASKTRSLISSKGINAGRILLKNNQVSILSCVGKDTDGKRALEDLTKYGFETSLVQLTNKHQTGQVLTIIDTKGNPSFTIYFGAIDDLVVPKNEEFARILKAFSFIYLETSLTPELLYKIIDLAKLNNTPILVDTPNRQKELDKTRLKNLEFLVPSRQEAELLIGSKIETLQEAFAAAHQLKQYVDGTVIITLDQDGCVILEKKGIPYHLPTRFVSVKDMTGAGDIFRAVFLDEYLKTKDIRQSAIKGLNLATQSVTIEGVDLSIETIKAKI